MKALKIYVVCLTLSLSVGVSKVNGGAVVGATEFTQIANLVQLTGSWLEQINQYRNMVDRLRNMDINTLLDPDRFFNDVFSDMQQLGNLLREGKNIAYSAGNIDAAFREKHRTFDEWASIAVPDFNPELVSDMARDWDTNTKDTIVAALKHTKFQFDDLSDEQATIEALRNQSETVEGRMQALQAISSVALEQLQQTQKLRAAINNMAVMQANYYAIQNEKEAFDRAFARQRDEDTVAPGRRTVPDNGADLY